MSIKVTGRKTQSYVMVMKKEEGENYVQTLFILDDNGIFPKLFNDPEEAVVYMVKDKFMNLDEIRKCKFIKVMPRDDVGDLTGNKEMSSLETFDLYDEKIDVVVVSRVMFQISRRNNNG